MLCGSLRRKQYLRKAFRIVHMVDVHLTAGGDLRRLDAVSGGTAKQAQREGKLTLPCLKSKVYGVRNCLIWSESQVPFLGSSFPRSLSTAIFSHDGPRS